MPNMSKNSNDNNKWGIVGHSKIIDYLSRGIISGNISHAYLFTGPKSVGKTAVTKRYIESLICENRDEDSYLSCNGCQSCKLFNAHAHPDVNWVGREVDETTGKIKKNISIEQIRRLQARLHLSSLSNNFYKFVVIEDADTLSLEAANALLKTLEEPSGKTVLILLAQSKAKLPLTIVSRCQVINFLPVNTKEIFDYLVTLKVDRKKANSLSALSFGCPGVALKILDDVEKYQSLLGDIRQFVDLLNSGTINKFKIVGGMVSAMDIDGLKSALSLWLASLRDIMLINNQMSALISSPSVLTDLEKVADKFDNEKIINMTNSINQSKDYLEANSNPRLTLENLVLNF